MAVTKYGKDFFRFHTFDRKSMKELVEKDNSQKIKELSKNQAMTRMQAIQQQDIYNKTRRPGYAGPKFESSYSNINFQELQSISINFNKFPLILIHFH